MHAVDINSTHALQHFVGDFHGLGHRASKNHPCEFFAADTAGNNVPCLKCCVGFANMAADGPDAKCRFAQYPITECMAVAAVDLFEIIEVNEAGSDRRLCTFGKAHAATGQFHNEDRTHRGEHPGLRQHRNPEG